MAPPRLIIRGRHERREFREPYRQCTEMLANIGIPCSSNVGEPVDFALFFQSYPHEFLKPDLAKLRRANPFAPFFSVLGVCCEGMLRTAGSLDSPFYCYAHAWSDREIEQIRLFLTDQPSIFALPLTAENDEIALWRNGDKSNVPSPTLGERVKVRGKTDVRACCPHPSPLPTGEGTVGKCLIVTHFGPLGNDSAMNRLIADEQRQLGFAPEFCYGLPSAVCRLPIFADVDDSPREKILESIQRLRQQFADNDFAIYVDSPRIDEKNDYIRAGVTRILPKIR